MNETRLHDIQPFFLLPQLNSSENLNLDNPNPDPDPPPPKQEKFNEKEKKIERLFQRHLRIVEKIHDKENNLKSISHLTSIRQSLEDNIYDERTSYLDVLIDTELRKEKTKNWCFLRGLINSFLSWYSQGVTKEYEQINASLLNKKNDINLSIAALTQKLPTEEEEHPFTWFKIESQWRRKLENPKKTLSNREKYKLLYDTKILPLLQAAKKSLISYPARFSIKAACNKGLAAHNTFMAFKWLCENQPIIKENGNSSQAVFVLPKQRVVFKISEPLRQEEEEIISALLDLIIPGGSLGAFELQTSRLDTFGIQMSKKACDRGYQAGHIPDSIRSKIEMSLTRLERLMLKNKDYFSTHDPQLENFADMEEKDWWVLFPGQEDSELFCLRDLQGKYLADQLPLETLITSDDAKALSLEDHIKHETPLFQALTFYPTINSPQDLYITPDLSSPISLKAYEICEKYKWIFHSDSGRQVILDFKSVHALYIEKKVPLENFEPKGGNKQVLLNVLPSAVNVKWKVMSPEIMQNYEGRTLYPLTNARAKPFLNYMVRMIDLEEKGINAVLERLTEESQFLALLTIELQTLDLHELNLGMVPVVNSEYLSFQNKSFTIHVKGMARQRTFSQLVIDYLNETISSETFIKYKNGENLVFEPLRNLPNLQKALDIQWELALFDIDFSLSEDNLLLFQYRDIDYDESVSYPENREKREHLIPFRSALLNSSWKDKPISPANLRALMHTEKKNSRIRYWITRANAPIYQRLSPEIIDYVREQISPLLESYSLSFFRLQKPNFTIKKVGKRFAKELSKMNNAKYNDFWRTLENELSWITVGRETSWKKIALQYKLDEETLRKNNLELNPLLDSSYLRRGDKIKIPCDLTSFNHEVYLERMKIASQFFPRASFRQQQALFQRQQYQEDYLTNFLTIEHSNLTGNDLISQLSNYIEQPTTPLSSVRRAFLLREINQNEDLLLNNPRYLASFKNNITKECQPTFFNLAKAVYWLLPDAYDLNEALDPKKGASHIGNFMHPLEESIQRAKVKFNPYSPERQLALNLEVKIKSHPDPAFFGVWNKP